MKTHFHLGTALLAAFTLFTTAPRAPAQNGWGNALSFDGTDDYVQDGDIPLANSSFTVEAWVQRRSSETVDMVVSQGAGGYNQCLLFGFHYYAGNQFVFDFYGNTLGSGTADTDTGWHHWAGTYDAPTKVRCLYHDGALIARDTNTADHYQGSGPLKIGVGPGGEAPNEFDGQIDDVRIWNVARSQTEIQANLSHPLTGSEPNLMAYWKFDEAGGTDALDSTTNGHHGTLVSGPVRTNSTIPPFININAGLPGVDFSSVAWGDYDNDGRLDILLTGGSGPGRIAQVWRNTGSGFTNINAGLPGVSNGSATWGDYDNDGRLDILLMGDTFTVQSRIAQVWQNTGSGFSNINAGLPGVSDGSAAWGDYDNDGRLDILLTGGGSASGRIAQVWRNTGGGFTNINAGLPGVDLGSAAWGDYDNDGRLDILLTGNLPSGRIAQVWRNTGSGFNNINAGLPGVFAGSVAWGDYDSDGRLDILLTGNLPSGPIAQVWRNTGSGFNNINAGLPGVYFSSAAWGDYDNDGRLDILLTGYTGSDMIAQVWRNTGSGFNNINAGLSGVDHSSVAWGDYDNDGRLDILLTGHTASDPIPQAQVWRNIGSTANTQPAPPAGLAATVAGVSVNFSWNPASDAETPAAGLSYNLRAGTTPGGSDVVSPQASAAGGRRVPALGNAQQRLSFQLTSPPLTNPVYWSVQAVDSAFAGSAFAPERSFSLALVMGPASGVVPGDTNGDGIVSQAELDLVLSNYFPYSPWLYLTNPAGLGGTNVTFALPNSPAGAFSVLMSTNLADWDYLGPATPRYEFSDTNAPANPRRYYRLQWP